GAIAVDYLINNIGRIIDNQALKNGLKITTSIVNSLFMIVALALALGMIITGGLNYQIKSSIVRLFVIALFVNFGVYLALLAVDIANVLTVIFVKPFNSYGGFTGYIADSLGMSRTYDSVAEVTKATGSSSLNMFLLLSTLIINYALLAFIFLYIAILLLFRNIFLIVLIILLPLALFAWIFNKSYFSKWFDRFSKWTFFPAVLSFFIYVSMYILSTTIVGVTNAIKNNLDSNTKQIIGNLYAFISVTVLMIMAISISRSFYISSEGVRRIGLKVGLGALAGTYIGTRLAARQAEKIGAHKDIEQQKYTPTALMHRMGLTLSRVPGLKTTGRKLMQRAEKVRKERREALFSEVGMKEARTDDLIKRAKFEGLTITAGSIPIIRELLKRAVENNDEKARQHLNDVLRDNVKASRILKLAEKYGEGSELRKLIARFNPEVSYMIASKRIERLAQSNLGRSRLRERYGTDDPEEAKLAFLKKLINSTEQSDWEKVREISPEFLMDTAKVPGGLTKLVRGALKGGNEAVIESLNKAIPRLSEEVARGVRKGASEAERRRINEMRRALAYLNTSSAKELLSEYGIQAENITNRERRLRSAVSEIRGLGREQLRRMYNTEDVREAERILEREIYKGITPKEFAGLKDVPSERMENLLREGIITRSHIKEALNSGSENLVNSISAALRTLIRNLDSYSRQEKNHIRNLISFLRTSQGEELLENEELRNVLNQIEREVTKNQGTREERHTPQINLSQETLRRASDLSLETDKEAEDRIRRQAEEERSANIELSRETKEDNDNQDNS
ncbi:MAG: hypothetical protein D6734_04425, partial [Candidatus Schekmanbacteria bacterium]